MRTTILFALVWLAPSCKQDPEAAPVDTFVPNISNNWLDTRDTTHYFSFFDAPGNVSQGTFRGNEFIGGVLRDTLNGSFTNRDLNFTVGSLTGGLHQTYTGRFIADTLIDLGTFKLRRRLE